MKKVKFGVFTDLHVDIMHDTQERLQVFLDACRAENVDFVIQLGDFCYPDDNRKIVCSPEQMPVHVSNALAHPTYADKNAIIRMYNGFEKPSYHVLGNHDCDMCTKEETLKLLEIQSDSYYSFDCGGFHFVVLDTNYIKANNDETYPYENGNYFAAGFDSTIEREWISKEQILWLEDDLNNTSYPTLVFSHAPISETIAPADAVKNSKAVHSVLQNAPYGVVACFNGHQHVDICEKEVGIWHVMINSISNIWLDVRFVCEKRYGVMIDEKYPSIKYTAPYKDPIYAIVTVDEEGIRIQGRDSEFVGPSPNELGLYEEDTWWTNTYGYGKYYASPSQKNRYLPIK